MYGLGNDFIVLDARTDSSVCLCLLSRYHAHYQQPCYTMVAIMHACAWTMEMCNEKMCIAQVSAAAEPKRATALTDRKIGIGCDQLIIMEVPVCVSACLHVCMLRFLL